MRERSVPCRYATLYETRQDKHATWNDSGVCDSCLSNQERFVQRGRLVEDDKEPVEV